jgi:hypothetical protein
MRYQPRRSEPLRPGRATLRVADGRASNRRRRREFVTTATDDIAIAPAARAGFRVIPNGKRSPIATGMSRTL